MTFTPDKRTGCCDSPSPPSTLEPKLKKVPLPKLKPEALLPPSHLFLCLSLTLSVFISHSPLRFLSSFFYLPVVESLPNEVADGSILQRDRVERSPTLKSINLTVSISVQTSLSYESKRSMLAYNISASRLYILLASSAHNFPHLTVFSWVKHMSYACAAMRGLLFLNPFGRLHTFRDLIQHVCQG